MTLLGGVLQKDLCSCCGIITVFPQTILGGIEVGNHSSHPFLVPAKVSVDRVYPEYELCCQNQFVFSHNPGTDRRGKGQSPSQAN